MCIRLSLSYWWNGKKMLFYSEFEQWTLYDSGECDSFSFNKVVVNLWFWRRLYTQWNVEMYNSKKKKNKKKKKKKIRNTNFDSSTYFLCVMKRLPFFPFFVTMISILIWKFSFFFLASQWCGENWGMCLRIVLLRLKNIIRYHWIARIIPSKWLAHFYWRNCGVDYLNEAKRRKWELERVGKERKSKGTKNLWSTMRFCLCHVLVLVQRHRKQNDNQSYSLW